MGHRTPYADLSELARIEAHSKQTWRPPYYIHKWWARRTGSVMRGLALDLLTNGGDGEMASFYADHDFAGVVACDPFMGGGSAVGELLRLGCKVVGCDVNPVAWYLVTQATRDVPPDALKTAFEQVRAAARPAIYKLYAATCDLCGGRGQAVHTGYVMQVECSCCGETVPLLRNHVIMADFSRNMSGAGLVDCPACGHVWHCATVKDEAKCPACGHRYTPAEKLASASSYQCQCGHKERIYKVTCDRTIPVVHRPRFVTTWCSECGKRHRAVSDAERTQLARIQQRANARLDSLNIPRQAIPAGYNTNQLRRYGYRYWYQLFTGRQLLALDAIFGALHKVSDEACRELLTLHASSILEFNSLLCTAKGLGTGAVRHAFSHHAFIPAKEPLEAHPWGVEGSSGGFASLYESRLLAARRWARRPTERRANGRRGQQRVPVGGDILAARPAQNFQQLLDDAADVLTLCQSSEELPQIPDSSVDLVVTDPPYADSVMYSELAEFFYVWLRTALAASHPHFAPEAFDDSREAVHNTDRGRDANFYTDVIAGVFTECERILKPGGRLAFTFHHGGAPAWQSVKDALVRAGLVVERWWPVFAEMEAATHIAGKEHNGHLDIVFVCARPTDIVRAAPQDSVGVMGDKLAGKVTLAAADHRALLMAKQIASATWRSARSNARADTERKGGNQAACAAGSCLDVAAQ